MESFFFNISEYYFQTQMLREDAQGAIRRTDISNGLVFVEASCPKRQTVMRIDGLDRMVMVAVAFSGHVMIKGAREEAALRVDEGTIALLHVARQTVELQAVPVQREGSAPPKAARIFVLFAADFFLKRYRSARAYDPIDYLYHCMQNGRGVQRVFSHPIDALSRHLIEKLLQLQSRTMTGLRAEHIAVEWLLQQLDLLEIAAEGVDEEQRALARRAKNVLLGHYAHPPTIPDLARECATNESTLKRVFRLVYGTTIRHMTQRLRLQEANRLLQEPDASVGAVAVKVGYLHQGYFSKLFFEHYGFYPKDLLHSSRL